MSEILGIRLLPENADRPIRPDLPWLRNLSWVKLHALQIGFGVGLLVFWSQLLGESGVAFGLAIIVAQVALGLRESRSADSPCEHALGVHDLREKPWYGITAAFWTWACAWSLWLLLS